MSSLSQLQAMLAVATALCGAAAIWFGRRGPVRRIGAVFAVLVVLLGVSLFVPHGEPSPAPGKDARGAAEESGANGEAVSSPTRLPRPDARQGFVSSEACRDCHAEQYASWHRTYHRTMTQPASAESVIPSFNDVTLESRGRTYTLESRGDEFWVEMVDPAAEIRAFLNDVDLADMEDIPRVERQVVMTTGSHHHQTYWIQNPNGTLIQFPWVYHINNRRWVFRTDSFLRPPSDTVHDFNIWNITCLECHSTGGQPRMNAQTNTMHSAAELGIACEACHGPGAYHVAQREMEEFGTTKLTRPPIAVDVVNPAEQTAEVSAQICGQCHLAGEPLDGEKWLAHGYPYRAGQDNFLENRRVKSGSTESQDPIEVSAGQEEVHTAFWPDGAVRTGGREYNGLIESACYTHGDASRQMSCLSCHSMHQSDPDKLVAAGMETNLACTQCHGEAQYTDRLADHTHHPPHSPGSLCYNCHMSRTSYALFMATRSHRIHIPTARTTTGGARPNACNLCHLDKTLAWTATTLAEWYGTPEPEMTEDEQKIAASLLWALRGDAAQRAVTAWHMGWPPAWEASGDTWQAPFLAELLVDPYSAVRYIAAESLQRLPGCSAVENRFDAPAGERDRERSQAIELWLGQPPEPPAETSGLAALLTGREVLQPEVRRLKAMRDDTPIAIFE